MSLSCRLYNKLYIVQQKPKSQISYLMFAIFDKKLQ